MQLHNDVYLWCAFMVFVFCKLSSNVVVQGMARAKTKIVDYPEDASGEKKVAVPNPTMEFDRPLTRAANLFRNDLENIVPFSLIALAAAFVSIDAKLYMTLLLVYAFARISHAACLVKGFQPMRSISYLVGQACALILVIMMIVKLIPIFQMM